MKKLNVMTNAIATSNDRRIFFLGVNTGYITDGLPDDRYVEFYRRRASSQLHCAIVGNVVVPGGHGSNNSTPTLSGDGIWSTIAASIAERGSIPGIQLASTWGGYVGNRNFVGSAPDQVIAAARNIVEELGEDGVLAVLRAFGNAAGMAVDHGFRHIQLHGAHGYLLNLLIHDRINPRAERARECLARLAEVLAADNVETSLRISMRTGDLAFDAVGSVSLSDQIAALPFDYIDLSSGFYNIDKRLIYPARQDLLRDRFNESVIVSQRNPDRNFIFSGRAMKLLENTFLSNVHVGICRDLIANPDFLSDPQSGCQNRSKCHYFSRGELSLRCALW